MLLLSITMLFSVASAYAQGGTTGPLTWEITGTGNNLTLTISGNGDMPDYSESSNAPWYYFTNNIKTIIIENGVTSIGNYAFGSLSSYYMYFLSSLTIGSSVTRIGDYAFYRCQIPSIIIPDKVVSIGNYAFCGGKLTSVIFPNSVTTIGNNAFSGNRYLYSVTLGSSVASIGDCAFYNCEGTACPPPELKTLTILAVTPPVCTPRAFDLIPEDITVIIPCLTFNSYINAPVWNAFTNYVIDGPSTPDVTFYNTKCYLPFTDNNFTEPILYTGVYYVSLPNTDNCDSIICLTLVENSRPQLCMISVNENSHNEIVWKANEGLAASYNIYREENQSGNYEWVANIESNSPNIWVDTGSNAQNRSYRYKIAGVDTCAKESVLSASHKTMNLNIGPGTNNSWILIWNAYEGVTFSTYNIYRATGETPEAFELIETVPAYDSYYIDFSAPEGHVYYMIEIVPNAPCIAGDQIVSIKSNIATNNSVGIKENATASKITVYPNPTTKELRVEIADRARNDVTDIVIFDIMGKTVMQGKLDNFSVINVASLAKGMYYLKVLDTVVKFVKD